MFITTPITLLVGQAGSGKDTVAGFLVKNHGAISIAQADPMKRLGKILFDFSEDQLWGPSESRNAPDPRYAPEFDYSPLYKLAHGPTLMPWELADSRLASLAVSNWMNDVFGGDHSDASYQALVRWFDELRKQTLLAGKTLTPRIMLQTLGTEWGRAQGRDLWSNYAISTAFTLLGGGHRYDRAQGLIKDDSYLGPNRVIISDGRFRNEVINVRRVGGSVVKIDSPSADGSAAEKAGVAGHKSETEQRSIPTHFFTGIFVNDKSLGLEHCEQASELLNHHLNGGAFVIQPEREEHPMAGSL